MDDSACHGRRRANNHHHPEHGRATRGRTPHRDLPEFNSPSSAFSPGEGSSTGACSSGSGSSVTSKIFSNVRRSLSYGVVSRRRDQGSANVGMQSTPEESISPTMLHPYTHQAARAPRQFHYGYGEPPDSPARTPTIEQIAMGLHISRTPHLGPAAHGLSHHPRTRSRQTDTPDGRRSVSPSSLPRLTHHRRTSAPALISPVVPTPRPRSSLKIPGSSSSAGSAGGPSRSVPPTPSASDLSLSTVTTSTTPSTPRSSKSANAASMAHFSTRLHLRMSKLLLPARKNSSASSTMTGTVSMSSDEDSASSEVTPRKVVRFSAASEIAGE